VRRELTERPTNPGPLPHARGGNSPSEVKGLLAAGNKEHGENTDGGKEGFLKRISRKRCPHEEGNPLSDSWAGDVAVQGPQILMGSFKRP